MRITGCEILHCNAGWRDFSFLKLSTDDGITGIAEYNECYGSPRPLRRDSAVGGAGGWHGCDGA